jgi:hypothetical protein
MSWLSEFLKPESDFDKFLFNLAAGAALQTGAKQMDPDALGGWGETIQTYGPAAGTAALAAARGERGIVPLLGAATVGEIGKRVAGQVFGRAPSLGKHYRVLDEEKDAAGEYRYDQGETLGGAMGKRPVAPKLDPKKNYTSKELDAQKLVHDHKMKRWDTRRNRLMKLAKLEEGKSEGLSGLWRERYDPVKGKWVGIDPIKIGALTTAGTYGAILYDLAEKEKREKDLPASVEDVREVAKSTLRGYEYEARDVENNPDLTDAEKAEQIAALQIKHRISLVRKLENLGPKRPVTAAYGGYIRGYQDGGIADLAGGAPPHQIAAAPPPVPVPQGPVPQGPVPQGPVPQGIAGLAGVQQPSMAASLRNLTDNQIDEQIERIVVSELTRRGIDITRELIEMAISKFRSDNNIPYKDEVQEDYPPMAFTPETIAESLMSAESGIPPGMEDVALAAGGGYFDRYRYGGMIDPLYEMGGFVDGPGGPKTDSIPARLSDGEFVMTADAVKGSGGPGVMYDMMDYFESRA